MTITDDARAAISTGMAWIFNTAQPDGAIDSHHGLTHTVGDRTFNFVPRGFQGSPVAVMEIREAARTYDEHGNLTNPLTAQDVADFRAALTDLGYEPIHHWNGAGTSTVSFQLAGQPHPTLAAALATYHRGCPEHRTPLCSWNGCDWFRTGHEKLVAPTWPSPTQPS